MLCRGHLICLLPICPCYDAVIQGPSRGQGAGLSFKTLVMGVGGYSQICQWVLNTTSSILTSRKWMGFWLLTGTDLKTEI